MSTPRSLKLFVAILAALYCFYYASTITDWHFIDNVDLLIHEAGHLLFLPFGQFMHVLMGSGFQILFPAVFVGYFVLQKDFYSASFCLMWVSFNIFTVSVYAGDAVRMQLPLLGGDNVEHDWHWILSQLHALQYTDSIANGMFYTGLLVLSFAVVGVLYFSGTGEDASSLHLQGRKYYR